jgi:tetratricopeptide (TPR) repeat protein
MIGGLEAPRHQRTIEISARTLAPDEALLLLADVAVELSRYEAAHLYFDEADALDGESQYRTNLMARRAIAYIHERKTSEGDALMGRFVAAGSDDGQVLGDIAHYAFDKYLEIEAGRAQGSAADELERAIGFGVRAVEADPANLESHYYLGLSYEAAGRLQDAVDELLAGYDINPLSPRLNMDLARALIKGRQHDYAAYLASRVYSASHAEEWRTGLEALMDDLADKDVDITEHPLLAAPWERADAP